MNQRKKVWKEEERGKNGEGARGGFLYAEGGCHDYVSTSTGINHTLPYSRIFAWGNCIARLHRLIWGIRQLQA